VNNFMFLGNEHLVKDFKKLAGNDRLSHGYIFFGENQIGKYTFALSLANFLENKIFELSTKTLSEALILKESGIDSVREIKKFLWQKPVNSKKRIVIINDADALTTEAQNAILKITEEPPEHSLIILIVNNTDNVLPPILSRLQKIYFSRINKKEISNYLVTQLGVKKDIAEKVGEMAMGRAGRAVNLVNNNFSDIENSVDKFLKSSDYARSQFIKNFIEDQKESPEILDQFFETLIIRLLKDPIKNTSMLKSVLSRLFFIKSYNVNKRLQIDAIVDMDPVRGRGH